MGRKIKCSVGVLAYNEEANIAKLLAALLEQQLEQVEISEVIVVSSASTDRTDAIVEEYARKHPRISLIREPERRGKSAAINTFIAAAGNDILVMESGDTIPAPDTVEKLAGAFSNPNIGMTGGRPVPENDPATFIGYSVNLLWRLHHEMALISPKLGEMVAFRRVFDSIPAQSAVDEASIEALIRDRNLELKYIPEAVVHNKGPETLSDFIKQRRRIASGHIWLKDTEDYAVTSQNSGILLKLTLAELKSRPRHFLWLMAVMFLEMYSRLLGWYDLKILKKNPFKWEIAASTKKLKHRNGNV